MNDMELEVRLPERRLGYGQGDVQALLRQQAGVWRLLGSGEVVPAPAEETLEERADLIGQVWEGMLAQAGRAFGLTPAEVAAHIAQVRRVAQAGGADEGKELEKRQLKAWAGEVAAVVLGALEGCERFVVEYPNSITKLWLLACDEAGARVINPRELDLRAQYFAPVCEGGWMEPPSWMRTNGSINRPFDSLWENNEEKMERPVLSGQGRKAVHAYGLKQEGRAVFRDDLLHDGLSAAAYERMVASLHAVRLPPAYPAAFRHASGDVPVGVGA
ncbi:hypothetical protein Dcar01_01815 [Deinococcus carri]|uniref:Uncharacterized protein n=1 Tax=Deinococcus carri TaxID=1211323 RepID=A0ABP9W6V2_9DEIO